LLLDSLSKFESNTYLPQQLKLKLRLELPQPCCRNLAACLEASQSLDQCGH
jgi:hypothetical protein